MSNERQYNFQNALGYVFNAFASVTDWKFDKEELRTIYNVIREWMPEDRSDEEVKACVLMTNGWVHEDLKDGGMETIAENVTGISGWLKTVFDKMDNPDKQKKFFLGDLVKIAMADDHFHEAEKKWIKILSECLDVEYSV